MTVRVISDGFSANLHPFGGLAGCVSSCSPNCLAVANRGGVLDVLLDGGGPFGADDAGSAGAKLQRPIGFLAGAVGDVGHVAGAVLKSLDRFAAFGKQVVSGIIWATVLGPPRCRKRATTTRIP